MITATVPDREGKAWIPLDDFPPGRSDVEFIALVDKDGSPIGDLQAIICHKPLVRKPQPLKPQRMAVEQWGASSYRSKRAKSPESLPLDPVDVYANPGIVFSKYLDKSEASVTQPGPGARVDRALQLSHLSQARHLPAVDRSLALAQAAGDVGVSIVIRDARELPYLNSAMFVEMSVGPHRGMTAPSRPGANGRVSWGESFHIGIQPADDLVLSVVTATGKVIGAGSIKGERLMGYKAHNVLVQLGDATGGLCGYVQLGVGGGARITAAAAKSIGTREYNVSLPHPQRSLPPPSRTLPPRALASPPQRPSHLPPQVSAPMAPSRPHGQPSFPLTVNHRNVVERAGRAGPVMVARPHNGRGICLRVHELRGRQPGALVFQVQDRELLQQATVEDALDAFFNVEMEPEDEITVRLVQRNGTSVATARFSASSLLHTTGKVEVPLHPVDGIDCALVLECLRDGPVGYVFGSREAMFASPAPMLLQ